MRVLAIDDEKLQAEALADAIKENLPDAEIVVFNSSTEAYQYASKNNFDVIFIDIEMPKMNGIEFTKMIKKEKPDSNIIFVTAYSEYALDAFSLRASGYVQKPVTAEKIALELNDLRHPMTKGNVKNNKLVISCFGPFEATVNGKPLVFSRSKSLELLAFLVDRKGARASSEEICKIIFSENLNMKNNKSYLRHLISDLTKALKDFGVEDAFIRNINSYSIDPTKVECDYYDFLDDKPYAVKAYRGEYMSRYEWAKEGKNNLI